MIIKTTKDIPSSEITDPLLFKQRRKIIKAILAFTVTASTFYSAFANSEPAWKVLPKTDALANTGPQPPLN